VEYSPGLHRGSWTNTFQHLSNGVLPNRFNGEAGPYGGGVGGLLAQLSGAGALEEGRGSNGRRRSDRAGRRVETSQPYPR